MPEQTQATFEGGLNVQLSPSKVADSEVVSALNVDFGLEDGALVARRGCSHEGYVNALAGSSGTTRFLVRVPQAVVGNSPYYASVDNVMYQKSGGFGYSAIATFTGSNDFSALGAYGSHAYFAMNASSQSFKQNIDSFVTSEWIKQAPLSAPALTISTLGPLALGTAWSITEGTAGGTAGTATGTTDATTNRVEFGLTLLSTDLNTNSGELINDYGTDFLDIAFDDPSKVLRISRDYSIGDTSFTNYYHTEYDLGEAETVTTTNEVNSLVDDQVTIGTSTDTAVTISDRSRLLAEINRYASGITTTISAAANTFNTWAVARSRFQLITKDPAIGGWSNIGAVRVVVEAISPVVAQVRNWEIRGNEGYPISDPQVGVRYFEKFVTLDSGGAVLGESAESPVSAPLKCQNARVVVVSTATATGSAALHGITHRVWYRTGGALPGPMAVATTGLSTATFTDTASDIEVLSNNYRMTGGLIRRDEFPGNVVDISEPHYDSLFVFYINNFMVSQPGVPDSFAAKDTYSISNVGDEVQKAIVWAPNLVVVNRDSVYEIQGNVFVGNNKNLSIVRTASKGSKARGVVIKTPMGIPMIDYDGLYFYQPGAGQAQEIGWLKAKLMDLWRGTATIDIPYLKGNRISPLNKAHINKCSAAYAEGRLYVAYPAGSDTVCKNMLVVDMLKQRVWTYSYPFQIHCLWWDFDDNRLMAGTDYAAVARLENGTTDYTPASLANVARSWAIRTRQWTTPTDLRLENFAVEHSNSTATVKAILDGTTTSTLGTLTASTKRWEQPGLLGVVANSVEYELNGTVAATSTVLPAVYNLSWDAEPEPKCNRYFRSKPNINNYDGDKLWDLKLMSIEARGTGTITSVDFVDGTAIMTNTIVIGTNTGQDMYRFSFPAETYGDVAFTTATSAQTTLCFKVWSNTFGARNQPPRINYWKTEVEGLEEQICDGWDTDINPNGTATGVCYVDNVAIATATYTGTKQQSFTWPIPVDTYGRTIYVVYTGSGFQHYKTWYHLRPEPDRWQNYKFGPVAFPADQFLKTWLPELNPLGTVIGTMSADGTAIMTATFVGTRREVFNEGVDVDAAMALRSAKDISIEYNGYPGGQRFKHYKTDLELSTKPFGKKTWAITYRKQGGATQLDEPRFYAYDIEATDGTATITSIFDVDGVAYETATWTVSGRAWVDRQAFYPGMRGQLFQHRLKSAQDFYPWALTLDAERTGVKGLSRVGYRGTPEAR
jgi:hypothetical protein